MEWHAREREETSELWGREGKGSLIQAIVVAQLGAIFVKLKLIQILNRFEISETKSSRNCNGG